MKDFIKELYLRVMLKSPAFFKKLRILFLSITAICGVLTENGINFTLFSMDVTKITAIAAAGAAIITFFAVSDVSELEKKLDKDVKKEI